MDSDFPLLANLKELPCILKQKMTCLLAMVLFSVQDFIIKIFKKESWRLPIFSKDENRIADAIL